MTELATLLRVKPLRGIPESDTSRDVDLQITCNAASRFVMRTVGLSLDGQSVEGELHMNVGAGSTIRSAFRPIDGLVTAQWLVGNSWEALDSFVVDPTSGIIRIAGGGDERPPSYPRNRTYRNIRLAYAVLASPATDDLIEAANLIAAHWDQTGDASSLGPVQSEKAGAVEVMRAPSLTARDQTISIPPIAARILGSYLTGASLAG